VQVHKAPGLAHRLLSGLLDSGQEERSHRRKRLAPSQGTGRESTPLRPCSPDSRWKASGTTGRRSICRRARGRSPTPTASPRPRRLLWCLFPAGSTCHPRATGLGSQASSSRSKRRPRPSERPAAAIPSEPTPSSGRTQGPSRAGRRSRQPPASTPSGSGSARSSTRRIPSSCRPTARPPRD
jgi:hypothetical protein